MMTSDDKGFGGPAEAWQRLALAIEQRTRRHPYGMVAAALGIGFVLGGGLSSRLAKRIVGAGLALGLRVSAMPFIEKELVALLAGAVGGGEGPRDPEAKGEVP